MNASGEDNNSSEVTTERPVGDFFLNVHKMTELKMEECWETGFAYTLIVTSRQPVKVPDIQGFQILS